MVRKVLQLVSPAVSGQKIYLRLGYPINYKPDFTIQRDRHIDDIMLEALSEVKITVIYARIPELKVFDDKILFLENKTFESVDLAKMLFGCSEIILAASIIDFSFVTKIQEKLNNGEISDALIYDAVAAETVDAGLSLGLAKLADEIKISDKKVLNKRFSAGYGDLALANQKIIYDVLELAQLGVTISESFMLKPEKAVTAITGVI